MLSKIGLVPRAKVVSPISRIKTALLVLFTLAIAGVSQAATTQSLFTSQTPALLTANDGTPYELGTRLYSDIPGQITAIRFWKSASETGSHTGHIWDAKGNLLATVTFANETASGWQQQALSQPLSIVANAEVLVSVNTAGGYFVSSHNGLASAIVSGNLHSITSSNGRYGSSGSYPAQTYQSSNYFRDVAFVPSAPTSGASISGTITPASAATGATVALSGSATQTTTADVNGNFTFASLSSGTYTVTPTKAGYTFTPSSLTVSFSGSTVSGLSFSASPNSTSSTQSLFTTQTPVGSSNNDGVAYELGTRLYSDSAGQITAIRFWKSSSESGTHVGHIWDSKGTLLATATFVNETASGWQQQSLSTPLAVTANAEYLVSVNTGNNYFVATSSGLASQVSNKNLHSESGSNGRYGSSGQYPTNSYSNSNYFRDVVFIPSSSVPAASVSVAVTPSTSTAATGGTVQFNAAVTGSSNTAVTWSVTGGSISPAGLYTAPGTAGTYTVKATSAADSTKSATGTVTVTAAPVVAVSISPTSATMKTGSTQQFAATVTGSSNTAVTWSASGSTISAAGMYTAPGTAGTYTVKATSAADTTKSASATVTVTIAAPQITLSPTAISFSSTPTNSSSIQTLTVANTGGSNLSVTGATVSGTGFSISGASFPMTIAAGQSAPLSVKFAPTTTGSFTGSVSVSSNASNSAPAVTLSGSATAASTFLISVSPTSLSFGSVAEGSSASKTVTLSNTGTGSVSITAANFTGSGFSLSGVTFPVTLAAGKTQNATISFAPETSGTASGTVSFVSNSTNSPATVALSGSGTVPTQHSVDLSWNASTSAVSGYNVYRSTVSGGSYTKLTSSPQAGTSYVDSTVKSGTTYYYVVTAESSSGTESSYSNQATAVVPTP